MKIQCSCGAKFSFDVQPEMVKTGVQFVCPSCGLDSSEHVTRLVWQQLASGITGSSSSQPTAAVAPPSQPLSASAPIVPAAKAGSYSGAPQIRIPSSPAAGSAAPTTQATTPTPTVAPPQPPAAPAIPRVQLPVPAAAAAYAAAQVEAPRPVMAPSASLNLQVHSAKPTAGAASSVADAEPEVRCAKHAEIAEEHCRVCSKPICPKCMELFGYVCSPLCKAKADSHGIHVPVFAGQKSVVERRMWRRTALIGGGIAAVIAGLLGFWFWYAWFGCEPKPIFSVRFEDPAWSGQVKLATNEQVVLLHGDVLARHDMKAHKEVWSRHLVDKKAIAAEVAEEMKSAKKAIDRANNEDPDHAGRMPDPEKLQHSMEKAAAAALQLRVHAKSIWIASPGKLTRYDWDTGNPSKEIALDNHYGNVIARDEELLMMDDFSRHSITHINMDTADMRSEELKMPERTAQAGKTGKAKPGKAATKTASTTKKTPGSGTATAGLPIGMPGKDAGKPLDPGKVAEQAQHLSLPAKIALPALLSGNASQERTLAELDGPPRARTSDDMDDIDTTDGMSIIPTRDGFVNFSVRLLESKIISRSAMKAPPAKSALEGNVTAGKSLEVANEILNEMQRSRGGDVVQEDESRYEVTLKQPNSKAAWRGEVIGRPSIFPLKTVTAITGNKSVMVFDKEDKKLWQSTLTFKVSGSYGGLDEEGSRYGQGPLVERSDTLYLFDEGVLSAFDLRTGNARWRIPSVGVAGLFFDQAGMLYVNTTTASPESIKYSRQIDISQKAISVVLKIDPKTGKTLWTAQPGGLVTHVLGNYIYCVQYYNPQKDEMEESPYSVDTGFETPPYLKIKRLNAKNGKEVWEHFQQRGPLDVQFDKNTIELVFKKEVQVLKFLEL